MDTAIPQHFLCPITCEVMTDPVFAQDGHTYERQAIEDWLKGHGDSPLTRERITATHLIPNYAMRSALDEAGYPVASLPAKKKEEKVKEEKIIPHYHTYGNIAAYSISPPPSYGNVITSATTATYGISPPPLPIDGGYAAIGGHTVIGGPYTNILFQPTYLTDLGGTIS